MVSRWKDWTPKRDLGFEFAVGTLEQHQVEFSWSGSWSMTWLHVDGVAVLRKFQPFRINTKYQVAVGSSEVHTVVVQKTHVIQGLLHFGIYVDDEVVWEVDFLAGAR